MGLTFFFLETFLSPIPLSNPLSFLFFFIRVHPSFCSSSPTFFLSGFPPALFLSAFPSALFLSAFPSALFLSAFHLSFMFSLLCLLSFVFFFCFSPCLLSFVFSFVFLLVFSPLSSLLAFTLFFFWLPWKCCHLQALSLVVHVIRRISYAFRKVIQKQNFYNVVHLY